MKSLVGYIKEDIFDINDKSKLFDKNEIEGIGEVVPLNKKEMRIKQHSFHYITNKNLDELIHLSHASHIKRFRLYDTLVIKFNDDSKMDFCDISLLTPGSSHMELETTGKNKTCTLSNAFFGPLHYIEISSPGEIIFDHVNISSQFFVIDNRYNQKGLEIPKFINRCLMDCKQYYIQISSNLINDMLMHPSKYQNIGKQYNFDTIPNKDACQINIHINKGFNDILRYNADYVFIHKSCKKFNKKQGTTIGDWKILRP